MNIPDSVFAAQGQSRYGSRALPLRPLLGTQLTDGSHVLLLSIHQGKPDKQANPAKP